MAKQRSNLNQLNFSKFISLIVFVASSCNFVNCLVINECEKTESTVADTEGGITLRGEWPFVVALYKTKISKFFCGGTLISTKHVLTAAHCVQPQPDVELLSDDIVVYLRAYNLLRRKVQEIYIHDEWNSTLYLAKQEYEADIALMILDDSVTFARYIRPACMPADDACVYDSRGYVLRWGMTENGIHEMFLNYALINTTNASYCYTQGHMSSLRMFCGESGGDPGSGFFVFSGSAWVQYGITSGLRTIQNAENKSIAIYTNVNRFKNWIFDIVNQSEGAQISLDKSNTKKISLNCDYIIYTPGYSCWVYNMNAKSQNIEIAFINGTHQERQTDEKVKVIQFKSGTMFYLPNEIGKFFKNLEYIWIYGKMHLKTLKRSNFYNLTNLVDLTIDQNDIHILEEDSLWDLPNLEFFYILNNKLSILDERTFHRNKKLRQVTLSSNLLKFLPRHLFKHNLLLEWIYFNDNLLTVIETDFHTLVNVKRMSFLENVCVDVVYDGKGNFTEFQNFLMNQCSSYF